MVGPARNAFHSPKDLSRSTTGHVNSVQVIFFFRSDQTTSQHRIDAIKMRVTIVIILVSIIVCIGFGWPLPSTPSTLISVNNPRLTNENNHFNLALLAFGKQSSAQNLPHGFDSVRIGSVGERLSQPPHHLSIQQHVYLVLTSILITCLIVADVIGVKIFELKLPFKILGHKSIEHTCGMLTFPITFVLGDVINEYYGTKATKRAVYIGFAMSILVFIAMNVAQAMPFLDKPFNGMLFPPCSR